MWGDYDDDGMDDPSPQLKSAMPVPLLSRHVVEGHLLFQEIWHDLKTLVCFCFEG